MGKLSRQTDALEVLRRESRRVSEVELASLDRLVAKTVEVEAAVGRVDAAAAEARAASGTANAAVTTANDAVTTANNAVTAAEDAAQDAQESAGRAVATAGSVHNLIDGTVNPLLAALEEIRVYTARPVQADPPVPGVNTVIPQMTITENFGGDPILICFDAEINPGSSRIQVAPYINGGEHFFGYREVDAGYKRSLNLMYGHTPAAGATTIDIRWKTTDGPAFLAKSPGLRRLLSVLRFGIP